MNINEGEERFRENLFSEEAAALEDPRILTRFVIHMFADLKKYHYYYWFAFPAVVLPTNIYKIEENLQPIQDLFSDSVISNINTDYTLWKKAHPEQSGFFWIQIDPKVTIMTLRRRY